MQVPRKDRVAAGEPPVARAGLANVLLIGDSISMGYTLPVAERLKGEANVRRPRANCGDTRLGLERLDEWLNGITWDVIHFNFGLHDLCYRSPESKAYGGRDKVNGKVSVPIDQYRENLTEITDRLARQTKQLIWASTTFVPAGEVGRHQGDDARYNAAAAEVMADRGVPINDLHALSGSFGPELFVGPGDVHFTDEGSARLADQVAACIREHL